MQFPLQQTKKWQKLEKDLGESTIFEETDDYTILAIEKNTKFGKYFYLPYGPVLHPAKNQYRRANHSDNSTKKLKTESATTEYPNSTLSDTLPALKNAAKSAYQALERLAQEKNVTFIRIEPQATETADFWANLPNSEKTKDLSPKETWVLDLTPEKSAIISGFAQGTRTRFNQFTRKGLSVTTSKKPSDIKYLVNLQHKLAHSKNFGTFSENYLKTELEQDFATLYLVHYDPQKAENPPSKEMNPLPAAPDDKIIAASLFFDHDDTRYYMQSAADLDYKKLPATVALLTTAIFDAKEAGLKNFDFWGIAPTDENGNFPNNHPWAGFTTFKKSFGGYEIKYCGTFDLIFKPAQYKLYKLARKGNLFLRKLRKNS